MQRQHQGDSKQTHCGCINQFTTEDPQAQAEQNQTDQRYLFTGQFTHAFQFITGPCGNFSTVSDFWFVQNV